MFQGGAVENLAVAQLPLHVAHDALPQRAHPGQVVRERLVHDAKDALTGSAAPVMVVVFPSPRLPAFPCLLGTWCYRPRRSISRIRRSDIRLTASLSVMNNRSARLYTTISTAPWSCSMRSWSYWIGSPASGSP